MKALILKEYNSLVYQDIPEPEISPDDVLIQVRACGICGSDIHGMDGSTGRRLPPIVMGHEASGIIAELGKNVQNWKTGDRVTFDSTVSCGNCHFCRKGEINLCDNRKVLGVSCEEYRCDGAFAEYVAVPDRILYRLPEAISFEQASFTEPLSVATHAVNRTPKSPIDTAVVVGSGMVGLLVVQALRTAGCAKIIAVDVEQSRLDLACKLGADMGLRADQCDVGKEVMQRTDNLGADIALEVVGLNETVKTAEAVLRKGGALTLVGNFSPTVDWPLQSVVTREISVYGSYISCGEYPACLEMMASGAINVDALISAAAPLAEGAAWFKRLYNREAGLMKVILIP
ncbi:MAG: galactitol-1-phosphate 5-dehydrogenase [Planctomycetota bacterium]|jgi:L-iditol 2-dehydrogenase